ncbi:methylated-DNA--[protein]-cysteine S-methyltransferase [Zobellella iuensis]|uniref:Methylated-DNA--protein-cysteine methyltransferase n=1 Tax=Zobellella iuensis TaxID=2803811 RepID=A0ABS1QPC7_9GAMM|nr:methylated-DNA--[protein]-cysteine S-methyltransferase [Zobellella iuensis]MBL1376695.1 methylated-DNA--[protein]-cysteine S-methyltransferase [Zobellella iuensis]
MHCTLPSPLGTLYIAASDDAILEVDFRDDVMPLSPPASSLLQAACDQLSAYFDGRLRRFELPLAPQGTPFQHGVWQALQTIPHGEHRSYKDIAESIGNPRAVRAVGLANGRNPISIIIPCHRVIGAGGKLVGYGGGLERKAWLLQHEAGQKESGR